MRAGGAGRFSPTQLESAVQRGDLSARNRSYLRGEANMQELANAMRQVLPSSYADSGTAGREAVTQGNVGMLAKLASPVYAAAAHPSVQPYVQSMLLNRSQQLRKTGDVLGAENVRALARRIGASYAAQRGNK
jgi:hypothetical protein